MKLCVPVAQIRLIYCMIGNITCFLASADFFKINFFQKFFQGYHQSVKRFGLFWIEIRLDFCWV